MIMEEQLTKDEIMKVKKLVEEYDPPTDFIPGKLRHIARKVCDYYCIESKDFQSQKRNGNIVMARRDFIHLAARKTNKNYTEIGRFLGRNHTTILHHIKKSPFNADEIINE